jgi:nucleotide-binding universal stress UspA family protein
VRRILVVACQTMRGRELLEHLGTLAAQGPLAVHVVVPVPAVPFLDAGAPMMVTTTWIPEVDDIGPRIQAELDELLATLGRLGITATGSLGPGDPIAALAEAASADTFDELVVSTMPPGISRWLRMDVPQRARRRFGDRVTTIINEEIRRGEPAESTSSVPPDVSTGAPPADEG